MHSEAMGFHREEALLDRIAVAPRGLLGQLALEPPGDLFRGGRLGGPDPLGVQDVLARPHAQGVPH